MNGKILKISSNDLYGNVDERKVALFVAFTHKKYMNNYAIFAFKDEYNKKKLCYASVHLKKESLVTFTVKDNELTYIKEFINQYINNKINDKEYEILDISKITKIELVSYREEDYNDLELLDKMSIAPITTHNKYEDTAKGRGFLYLLLIILVLLLIGVTYLYFNPDLLTKELKQLNCTMDSYDKALEVGYTSEAELKFNDKDKLSNMHKIDTYLFNDEEKYLDFKNNNKESSYFNVDGGYKYNDEELSLKIIYQDILVIDNYDEVLGYLKNEGYTCQKGTYYE